MCIRDRLRTALTDSALAQERSMRLHFHRKRVWRPGSRKVWRLSLIHISKEFPSVPVSIEVYDAPEVDLTDECVNYRPENYRAFENTWEYYNLLGR